MMCKVKRFIHANKQSEADERLTKGFYCATCGRSISNRPQWKCNYSLRESTNSTKGVMSWSGKLKTDGANEEQLRKLILYSCGFSSARQWNIGAVLAMVPTPFYGWRTAPEQPNRRRYVFIVEQTTTVYSCLFLDCHFLHKLNNKP